MFEAEQFFSTAPTVSTSPSFWRIGETHPRVLAVLAYLDSGR
jgi:hypothetical protein